jgi:hypothetical protein
MTKGGRWAKRVSGRHTVINCSVVTQKGNMAFERGGCFKEGGIGPGMVVKVIVMGDKVT